jgi:hypothetical protein
MDSGTIQAGRGSFWAAELFEMFIDGIGSAIDFVKGSTISSPEHCKTPQDLRDYANSIRSFQPSFADELLAAADRADSAE